MSQPISNTAWVYVIIQNPGGPEKLVGFNYENNIKYIPVLRSKEDAEIFLSYMQREPGTRYEVQAIIYEDLLEYAKNFQFSLFLVDKEGKILDQMNPNE